MQANEFAATQAKSAYADLGANCGWAFAQPTKLDKEERRLMMRLAPLYEPDLERAMQEGIPQGIQQGIPQGIQPGEGFVMEKLLGSISPG